MAINNDNPMSAMSYTNKDFQTIYPELLEAAKNLARNWDPTISNESDPGVVLLKLNAIIADKNNYNIDKNILENYPETYTQEFSARSQYSQLGYRMPWYRAATVDVSFRYIPEEGEELTEDQELVIPAYTSVADTEGTYVYTILEDIVIKPSLNSKMVAITSAIQGIKVDLKINGNTRIGLGNLDSRNRLYIDDYNVAENGILVRDIDSNKYGGWIKVDNVELQPLGTKCFEFDIDPMSSTPFIQFPQDIRNTIGSGIAVSYIMTDGRDGNITAGTLNKFESTTSAKVKQLGVEVKSISLTDSNMKISNTSNSIGGAHPETVEEAYHSYKRYVHTFNTLVTLRDYMNAIYNSNLVANSLVSDRTTDVVSHYVIKTKDNTSVTEDIDIITKDEEHKEDTMTAFDLRLYLLGNANTIINVDSYNDSFKLDITKRAAYQVATHLEEEKSIQHNYVDLPLDEIILIQNIYPINIKIIPTYKVSNTQQDQIKNAIKKALIESISSKNCIFGQEPDYEKILNTISEADDRIKVAILDDFEYVSYAMYIDTDPDETVVNRDKVKGGKGIVKMIPVSKFDNRTPGIFITNENLKDEDINDSFINKKILADDSEDPYKYSGLIFTSHDNTFWKWDKNDYTLTKYSDKLTEFRKNIIAKNILAGITPLFETAYPFDINILMNTEETLSGKEKYIYTNLDLNLSKDKEYELRENEVITFTGPSFIPVKTYSTYTKYLTSKSFNGKTGGEICLKENDTYQLKSGEWIIFFLRGEGDESDYEYRYYGPSSIIRPNFSLTAGYKQLNSNDDYAQFKWDDLSNFVTKINQKANDNGEYDSEHPFTGKVEYTTTVSSAYMFIKNKLLGSNSTSGSRQIEMCRRNYIKVEKSDECDNRFYYIISNNIYKEGNKERYELSLSRDAYIKGTNFIRYSKTLGSDEFFIYTNKDRTLYEVLGEGSLVEVRIVNAQIEELLGEKESLDDIDDILEKYNESASKYVFTNDIVKPTDIELNGISAFKDDCKEIAVGTTIVVSEQLIYSFAKNDIITFTQRDGTDSEKNPITEPINISSTDDTMIDNRLDLNYIASSGSGKLPIFELNDPYYNWRASAALHVKMDNEKYLKILPNLYEDESKTKRISSQQIGTVSSTKTNIWNEGTNNPEMRNLYLLCSTPIDKLGSNSTDISYIPLLGGDSAASTLLAYFYVDYDKSPTEVDPETGYIKVEVKKGAENNSEIEVKLNVGKYLMPINAHDAFNLNIGGTMESCMKLITGTSEITQGINYYLITIDDNYSKTLKFYLDEKSEDESQVIDILPMKKIKFKDELFKGEYEISTERILETLSALDKNHIFKYDYVPDRSIQIEDPLLPRSFFDREHVFNSVCIPKGEIGENLASYLFINNR